MQEKEKPEKPPKNADEKAEAIKVEKMSEKQMEAEGLSNIAIALQSSLPSLDQEVSFALIVCFTNGQEKKVPVECQRFIVKINYFFV